MPGCAGAGIPREARPEDGETGRDVLNESYEALLALGHSERDARAKIELAVEAKGKVKSVEDLLQEIYRQDRDAG